MVMDLLVPSAGDPAFDMLEQTGLSDIFWSLFGHSGHAQAVVAADGIGHGSSQMGTSFLGHEPNVMVTDPEGQPSHAGLLQVRMVEGGPLGTVCGANREAADVACRTLGFSRAVLPQSSCVDYGGTNHCGAPTAPVAVKDLQCTGDEVDISECRWEEPGASCADHRGDTVVYCSNGDMTQPENSVRLLNAAGAPSINGTGRLEVYHEGQWGPVCAERFTRGSAQVACKQMGFDGVEAQPYSTCRDVQGEDFCSDTPPHVQLSCDGTEGHISGCSIRGLDDTFCAPKESVVLKCIGHGSTAGLPQYPAVQSVCPSFAPTLSLYTPCSKTETEPSHRYTEHQLAEFIFWASPVRPVVHTTRDQAACATSSLS